MPCPSAAKAARDPIRMFASRLKQIYIENAQKWRPFQPNFTEVAACSFSLTNQLRLYDIAVQRGWKNAEAVQFSRVASRVRHLEELAKRLREQVEAKKPEPPVAPSFHELLQELQALQNEFSRVVVNSDLAYIDVYTDSISLSDGDCDITFGKFKMRLTLARLAQTSRGPIRAVAVSPNRAADSHSDTHPHVRDDEICLGDAEAAVKIAVRDGRLLDAFMLVNAVLHNYNADSPYTTLGDWEGSGSCCSECGARIDEEESYYCDTCERTVCDGCSRCCDQCDLHGCRSCIKRGCQSCREFVCEGCLVSCDSCSNKVCTNCQATFDDGHYCPKCRATCDECAEAFLKSALDSLGRCEACAALAAEETAGKASKPVEPEDSTRQLGQLLFGSRILIPCGGVWYAGFAEAVEGGTSDAQPAERQLETTSPEAAASSTGEFSDDVVPQLSQPPDPARTGFLAPGMAETAVLLPPG